MSGVYEGLTVVELADRRNQWAGKLMADGGARVIQIELINGSPGRWCGPFVDDTLGPFGLDYGSVSANRALIDASLTDFGQGGPWRDYRMNDAAHLALGGQMASTGYSDPAITPIGGHGYQAWHMWCVSALHGSPSRCSIA